MSELIIDQRICGKCGHPAVAHEMAEIRYNTDPSDCKAWVSIQSLIGWDSWPCWCDGFAP